MLATFNHSVGININNNVIKVNIEIVIVKELDKTILPAVISTFFKSVFL